MLSYRGKKVRKYGIGMCQARYIQHVLLRNMKTIIYYEEFT